MKNFLYLIALFSFFLAAPNFSTAQVPCPMGGPDPLPFAAGEILIDYVGSPNLAFTKDRPAFQNCKTLGQPNNKWYEITLNYFIECIPGKDFENTYTLYAINKDIISKSNAPSTDGLICFDVTFDKDLPSDTRCVVGQPLCTDGERFKGRIALPESATPWKIVFGFTDDVVIPNSGGKRRSLELGNSAHTTASFNIDAAQGFMVKSEVLVYCEDITTTGSQSPPNVTVRNNLYNNRSAYISTDEMVESFCASEQYAFQLPIKDTNEVKDLNINGTQKNPKPDSLDFQLHGAWRNFSTVTYVQPYTSSNPLPSPFGEPLRVSDDGFFTYEPELPKGEQSFFGIVTYKVSEFRKAWHLDDVNTPNGTVKTLVHRYPIVPNSFPPALQPSIVTYKQFMYVLDTKCVKNLPEFSSTTWNEDEKAWEFACQQNRITLDLSEPVLAESVDRLDFRLFRGDTSITVADNPFNIDSIVPLNINASGETQKLRIVVNDNGTFGPGRYSLFTKLGTDKNTLLNRCGFELDENVIIPIFKRDDPFTFNYLGTPDKDDNVINVCYPQDDIVINPLLGQSSGFQKQAGIFTYQYVEFDPDADTVTVLGSPKKYTVPKEFDAAGNLINKPEGLWIVGVGLVFKYTYNGENFRNVCYATDRVQVNIFENIPVKPRTWDLCPEEEWPVIKLDSMTSKHNAQDYKWGVIDELRGPGTFPIEDARGRKYRSVGGASSAEAKNDSLDIRTLAFGTNNFFQVLSIVELESGECFDETIFYISKETVKVDIGKDTLICREDDYFLNNTFSYLIPDSISYEWKLDDVILPDAITNVIKVEEEGEYVLTVTKRSTVDPITGEQVMCSESDTVLITYADELTPPQPTCNQVTFIDGIIKQTFFWPEIEGAETYQVKQVNQDGVEDAEWSEPNGDYNQLHNTEGDPKKGEAQIKLLVRAVNLEVPEDAICRYGPQSSIAESCEIIIKPVNIFTPNGDGINDVLRFDLLEVYFNEGNPLQVFNRWGKLVYESSDYLNDWDGGDQKDGTYFYVLKVNDKLQTLLKGTVTIVR